jgi:uncharacterized protein YjdB
MKTNKVKYVILTSIFAAMTVITPFTASALPTPKIELNVGDKIGQYSIINIPYLDKEAKGLKVKWEISNSKIAKMSSKTELIGLSAGTTHVKAYVDGHPDINYEFDAVVKSTTTGITMGTPELHMTLGEKGSVDAEVLPMSASDKVYKSVSSNPKIVSVTSKGELHATGIGTATITATAEDGGYTAIMKVVVTSPINGIYLDNQMSVAVGESISMPLSLDVSTNDTQTLLYIVADKDIAKISTKGIVTGLKEGSTDVDVSTMDGLIRKKITIHVTSDVNELYIVDKDSVAISTLPLEVGQVFKFLVTNDPYDVLALTKYKPKVESSDKTIVSVATGTSMKALKAGTATITVTLPQETSVSISKTITVHVAGGIHGITLDQNNMSILVGEKKVLTATIDETAMNKKLTWKSDDSKIATITNGNVTGIAPGTTIVHAISPDGTIVSDATVEVTGMASDIQAPDTIQFYIGDEYIFNPTVLPEDTLIKTVLFKLSKEDKSLLLVKKKSNGDYTLTGLKAGVVNLELYSKDGNITKTIPVTILDTSISLCILDSEGNQINK